MEDAYGIKDMVFGGMKIKHKDLPEWLYGISNRIKLVKIVYKEGNTAGHAIGIIEGERTGELYFLKFEDVNGKTKK